jgi:dienelactone hydrolase
MPFLGIVALCTPPVVAQESSPGARAPVGEEAYRVILESYQYDRDIPLEAQVLASESTEEYTREKIVFRSRDSRVPGYLAVPRGGSPPYSLVLLLHGQDASKSSWWQGIPAELPRQLHAAGIAVLALDAQYHGERALANDFEPWEGMFRRRWLNRVDEALTQSIIDYRRALDYVETRGDIDAGRVGVYGYSMGGLMSYVLTAIDDRVGVTVVCVAGPSPRLAGRREAFQVHNFVRAFRDRPIMILLGRSDPIYSADAIEPFFASIDSRDKELVWYDSGHRLPPEHIDRAVTWFVAHLGK